MTAEDSLREALARSHEALNDLVTLFWREGAGIAVMDRAIRVLVGNAACHGPLPLSACITKSMPVCEACGLPCQWEGTGAGLSCCPICSQQGSRHRPAASTAGRAR